MVLRITREKVYWFGVMMYIALSNTLDAIPGGQLILLADLLLIIAATMKNWSRRFSFYFSGLHAYVILFTVFSFSTMLWAQHPEYVVSKATGVLVNCCAVIVISLGSKELKDVNQLLKVVMRGYYIAVIIAIVIYGPSQIVSLIQSSDRIAEDSAIERNTIGMAAAYAVVINTYLLVYQKKLHTHDLLSIPSLFLIIATGSRKAMLILVAGIVGIFVLKNWSKRLKGKSFLKIFSILLVIILLLIMISQLPMFSGMMERMNDVITALNGTNYTRSNTAWIRFEYIALGMRLFAQNPILGIGLGNSNVHTQALYGHFHYLHNNYVELLAAGGIVGTTLYYSIYVFILWTFWKYRKYRNAEYDVCLVILLIRLVMDYGAVFFYSKEAYIFLILFWYKAAQLRSLKKDRQMVGDAIDLRG